MTAPTLSVLLIGAPADAPTPPALAEALARGEVLEVVRADGVDGEAVRRCAGELVWPLTADAEVPTTAWRALADVAEANPDAGAFRLDVTGLAPDPAWRGRRCRAHERNLESLRFANLIPLGGLAIRRDLLAQAAGADWRGVAEQLARVTRIAPSGLAIARRQRLPNEPPAPGFAPPEALGRPRVLVLGQIEVSTSLYFDVLQSLPDVSVGFRPLTRLSVDAPHLAAADLVILVRDLHRFWDEGVIAFLTAAGTPFVYFTDDNFLALRTEGAASSFYSLGRVRRTVRGAAAVWTSTLPLCFAYAKLNPRVSFWRPALDPILLAEPRPPASGTFTIAIAGGDFRLAGLTDAVLTGLRAIAEAAPLRILCTEAGARRLAAELEGVEIVALPMERSFRQFVRQWRRFGVDILLHPEGPTRNAPYKCPTSVIVARYLGAQPVVADEPAYDGWGVNSGVIRIGEAARGLRIAARRGRDPIWHTNLGGRLALALDERFSLADRAEKLALAMEAGRGPGRPAAQILASPGFRLRLAWLWLARTVRRVLTLSR